MEFSNEIMDIISKIMKAEQIVIYGAKQRASDIFIACETLAGRDKLTVMVTHLDGKEQYLNGDVPIRELSEVTLNQSAVVIIAMGPHFFHEVRQYPQLKAAGCVLYADSALLAELLRYAAFYSLKKVGLDLRLFGKVSINDIRRFRNMSRRNMWNMSTLPTLNEALRHASGY